ncbi:unnamed protein product [Lupinus luteus]|uniref:Bifunctional inhibitor/plant lipid transfer protein/seed storage helical domain-containing protein n=1 Tax=Lupinus luteus TaxID=3873 RepID=A0AAV1VUN8_LUPLU
MTSFVGVVVLAMVVVVGGAASYAQQISTPCNTGMLNRLFTPCVNFITSSSGNGTSPTTECCSALNSLTSVGVDCLCLLVTASVPFKIPINRTIAISLPRACNIPGVPLQCKASGSPLPAPGPVSVGASPSPSPSSAAPIGFTPTASPQAAASSSSSPSSSVFPSQNSPSLAPNSDNKTPLLTPPLDSGIPSSAMSSYNFSSSLLLFIITFGFSVLQCY